jgi:hypothetical protein
MVKFLAAFVGIMLIGISLWEGFETIILPRRVTRRFRLTRLFYRSTWVPWNAAVNLLARPGAREHYISFYGPLSLLLLFGIWVGGLILGFALLHFSTGSTFTTVESIGPVDFWTDLYLSGTTFFTLGLGDVAPRTPLARFLTVAESGMGFGFLALVIGYLPALNQSFARREVTISLLDARAGSPATAAEMIRRHARDQAMEALRQLLHDWERWSAELLESHLSYPVLAYFRSHHDNQSWLAALTVILDTCALVMVGLEGACERQAELTFAITRHAVVDLSHIFTTHLDRGEDRLPPAALAELRGVLSAAGVRLRNDAAADERLAELRSMYEPYVISLARRLRLTVPPWYFPGEHTDNWQASGWEHA